MHPDDLYKIVVEYLQNLMTQACTELAEAYASAIQGTAPVDTGTLAGTAAAEGPAVMLQDYWKYVAFGHRIYSPKTQELVIKRIDASGEPIYAYSKPNPYMEKAWASPQVQAVLQKYAGLAITIPYPLAKVDMEIQNQ